MISSLDPASALLQVGQYVPSVTVILEGVEVDLSQYFRNKVGILFGVQGAFMRVCSERHVAGYRDNAKQLRSLVDFVGCLAVNDPYVLRSWARDLRVNDEFVFISDYNGDLAKRFGVLEDFQKERLGARCRRFAAILGDAVVQWVGFDEEAFYENALQALLSRPKLLRENRPLLPTRCLALTAPGGELQLYTHSYRQCGPLEVAVSIKCVCVTGADAAHGAEVYGPGYYPMVPGHEAVGEVTAIGSSVTLFKLQDRVGIGYVGDSCGKCEYCRERSPHLCRGRCGWRPVFNSRGRDGVLRYGCLAERILIEETFAVKIPPDVPSDVAAPLMRTGSSIYAALKKVPSGSLVGVVATESVETLNPAAALAVQIAQARGLRVAVVVVSEAAEEPSCFLLPGKAAGAPILLPTEDCEFHHIVDTVTMDPGLALADYAPHVTRACIRLLRCGGEHTVLGLPPKNRHITFPPDAVVLSGRTIQGIFCGSLHDTEAVLQLAAAWPHIIKPEIRKYPFDAKVVDLVMEELRRGSGGTATSLIALDG